MLGCEESLSYAAYPQADPTYLEEATVTYVVQVDGRVRARLELPKDQSEEVITEMARTHANVVRFLDGKAVNKVIFVPNKLLNLVTGHTPDA